MYCETPSPVLRQPRDAEPQRQRLGALSEARVRDSKDTVRGEEPLGVGGVDAPTARMDESSGQCHFDPVSRHPEGRRKDGFGNRRHRGRTGGGRLDGEPPRSSLTPMRHHNHMAPKKITEGNTGGPNGSSMRTLRIARVTPNCQIEM